MTDQASSLFVDIGATINAIKKELQRQQLLNAKMEEQLRNMKTENQMLSYLLAEQENGEPQ